MADGTSGNDTLVGTIADDLFNGLGGNDSIIGDAGNDTLNGDDGIDTIRGGAGNDLINGGVGDDVQLWGDDGNDTIYGGDGNDSLSQGSGFGLLDGGAGNDNLSGGSGGVDTLLGGEGNDSLSGIDAGDIVDGGTGDDTFFGISTGVAVNGGAGNDTLYININSPYLGTAVPLTLGEGQDTVHLSVSPMTFMPPMPMPPMPPDFLPQPTPVAEAKIIIADFDAAGGEVVNLSQILPTSGFPAGMGIFGWDGVTNPWNTTAGGGFLRLRADGADTIFEADQNGGGDNFIPLVRFQNIAPSAFTAENFVPPFDPDGSANSGHQNNSTSGNDTLVGTIADDLFNGLGGNDSIIGDAGNDTLNGDDGIDTIRGGAGNDLINGGVGDDVQLWGDDGNDTIYGGDGNDSLSQGSGFGLLDGGAGNDNLSGGSGGVDTLLGGEGNDSLSGIDAGDIVDGGTGDDTFFGISTGVAVNGGAGNDTLYININSPYLGTAVPLTLGEGQDTVHLSVSPMTFMPPMPMPPMPPDFLPQPTPVAEAKIIIADFDAAGGEVVNLSQILPTSGFPAGMGIFGWDGVTNPWNTTAGGGFLRLRADGADTIFEADQNGGGDNFIPLVRFQNIAPSAFTAENFVPPFDPDGSANSGHQNNSTSGNDTLVGTIADDLFNGLGGNDSIIGDAGNDTLNGDDGIDTIRGGAGNDLINGGVGDDVQLWGDDGNDTIYGGDGNDSLSQGSGFGLLDGGAGNDNLSGGSGGVDTLLGGEGNDSLSGIDAGDIVDGGTGDDTFFGISTGVAVNGGAGNDTLYININSPYLGTAVPLTLGEGQDTVHLSVSPMTFMPPMPMPPMPPDFLPQPTPVAEAKIIIADFDAAGGEVVNLSQILPTSGFPAGMGIFGWDGVTNPWNTTAGGGFLRLRADGADTIFEADQNGGGDNFIPLVRFQNIAPSAFTAENFRPPFDPQGVELGLQNLAPDDIAISLSPPIPENSSGLVAGILSATDPNGPTGLSFSLVDNAGGRFAIVNGNQLQGIGPFDFETATSHQVTVRVTDTGGLSRDESFTIQVADMVELPPGAGTPGPDSIIGTAGNDTLTGLAGDDTLVGLGGADSLVGGSGFDIFTGGAGNDTLDGSDTINGSDFDDDLVNYAGEGGPNGVVVNLVTGVATDSFGNTDTLIDIEAVNGTAFADSITGGNAFNDEFETYRPLAGADTIHGGTGTDEIRYDSEHLVGGTQGIVANLGIGTIVDTFGTTDTVSGIENIRASNFADNIIGDGANNRFRGLRGNDTMDGAGGFDEVDYRRDVNAGGNAAVNVNLGTGTATDGFGNTDTLLNIEAARGTNFNDQLTGSSGNNRLRGEGGDDTLRGGGGNDTLAGNAGFDVFVGGSGNDTLDGSDTINGSDFDLDTASYFNDGGTSGVSVNLVTGTATDSYGNTDTLIDIEEVQGTAFNDLIVGGNTFNDEFELFRPMAGADSVHGGSGTDEIRYDNEHLNGGTQGIIANLNAGYIIDTYGSTDTVTGIENIRASAFADTITGDGNSNRFRGLAGNDTMDGAGGIDEVDYRRDTNAGGNGAVTVNLGLGTATDGFGHSDVLINIENVRGTNFNDTVIGDGAANRLRGEGGNDTLEGGEGDDRLEGGFGSDSIDGGSGIDRAEYTNGFALTPGNTTFTPTGFQVTEAIGIVDTYTRIEIVDGAEPGKLLLVGIGGSELTLAQAQALAVTGDTIVFNNNGSIQFIPVMPNQAPTDIILSGLPPIDENTSGQTGTLTGVDPNPGDVLTYSLLDDAGGRFSLLNGNQLVANGPFDFEAAPSHQITLRVTDAGGLFFDKTFTINVGDVVEGVAITGTPGADTLTGTIAADTLSGLGGDDTLVGQAGDDSLVGGSGFDVLIGGGGNDTLDGSDTINGSDFDDDTVSYLNEGGANGVVVNLVTGIATDSFGASDTLIDIENVNGTNFADSITGGNPFNDEFESFRGFGGADTIDGGSGFDEIRYDNEHLAGGTQGIVANLATGLIIDTFGATDVVSNIELVRGSNFADDITGDGLNNRLRGLRGNDTLDGGGGIDEVDYRRDINFGGNGAVTVNLAAGTATDGFGNTDTLINIENARGTNLGDTLIGNSLANRLRGEAGNDTLSGGAGNDTLEGGDGNDVFTGGAGSDSMVGGAGNDTVDYSLEGGPIGVRVNVDGLETQGGIGPDSAIDSFGDVDIVTQIRHVIGTEYGDTLHGSDRGNILTGNGGMDDISGHEGNDTLSGGDADDTLNGGSGSDSIDGGAGIDRADYSDGTSLSPANISLTATGWQVNAGNGDVDTYSNIEILDGAEAGKILLVGNGSSLTLEQAQALGVAGDTILIAQGGTIQSQIVTGNLAPTDIAFSGAASVNENASNIQLGAFTGVDPNAGDMLSYALIDDAAGRFSLNGSNLVANSGFDFEAASSHQVTVRVTDAGGLSFDKTFTIEVADINEAPSGVPGGLMVDEDGVPESRDLLLGATDPDIGQTAALTIGNIQGLVAGVTLNGSTITVDPGHASFQGLAAGQQQLITLTYDIVDPQGLSQAQMTEIRVNGVNDAPTLSADGGFSTGANTAIDIAASTLLTNDSDVDSGAILMVTSVGDAVNGTVSLTGSTVTFTPDAGYVGAASFTYTVSDGQGGTATQTVSLTVNSNSMTGSPAADILNGTSGPDSIDGLGGNDQINGGDGDDTLIGGLGRDTLNGGAGDDTFGVDQSTDVVIEGAEGGYDTILSSVSYTAPANVEAIGLIGTANINAVGNALDNLLTGNTGVNVLNGGLGADTMEGGLGNDLYIVDNEGDIVVEQSNGGFDRVDSSISYTLGDHVERLVLTGSADIEGTGNSLANVMSGNSGNNILAGGDGIDTLAGGLGDDTYIVTNTGESIIENANSGTDTIQSTVSITLAANVENLELLGFDNLNGTGNALDNMLTGNAGNNVLNGGLGADTMAGGLGNDSYVVDDAGDLVTEDAEAGFDRVDASVSFTLGENIERLQLTGTADIDGTGNAESNVIIGNSGANQLDGGDGNDTLSGGAGDDLMVGGLGNDVFVVGEAGDIVLENADEGYDRVESAITYALGDNIERLVLTGSENIDGTGNALANLISGNAGDNVLAGGDGIDTLAGGLGDDTYIVTNAGESIIENADAGTDTIRSSVSFAASANVEILELTGTADINGTGNALDNTIIGNDGANILNGGLGADTMSGGLGNDIYIVDEEGDAVTEDADGGYDRVDSAVTYTLGANIERLGLTGSDDIDGTGNALSNLIIGNAGNNMLDGGDGNDTLNGLAGTDTMIGGLGNDVFVVDDAGDMVTENADEGYDRVEASVSYTLGSNIERLVLTGPDDIDGTGNDLANMLNGNGGQNVLDGGDGNDTLIGGLNSDRMIGGLGNDVFVVDDSGDLVIEAADQGYDRVDSSVSFTLGDNIERLNLLGSDNLNGTGNGLSNVLVGNAGNNMLDGAEGNDTLNGGLGADTMTGGLGNDVFAVDDAGDVAIESADQGYDRVDSSVSFTLGANIERLNLLGSGDLNGTGNGLANVLVGNAGNNMLDGGDGNDTLNGGLGADTMTGGLGNDVFTVDNTGDVIVELAGGGIDRVDSSVTYTLSDQVDRLTLTGADAIDGTGNSLNNILLGNGNANRLDGAGGNDSLNGGAGSDTLIGGLGNDTQTGGSGDDTFVFVAGSGRDVVTDFQAGAASGDVVSLSFGTAFDTYAEVMAAAVQVGANVVITFDAANSLTLQNTLKANLTVDDFTFF